MIIYNLVIFLYGLVIRIASVKNPKAKLWVEGRSKWQANLKDHLKNVNNNKRIWVHCASLGEFEQGRPIIEAIKVQHPQYSIILTFFSPSGYEACKNYKEANVICYLPLDTKSNAQDFLEIVDPQIAIFIKYEFWVNFLTVLKQRNIDTYLVSAVFKDHHPFFKWYGGLFVRSLRSFKKLLVQDQHSLELLKSIGFDNAEICGDTRFDRVLNIKLNFVPIPEIENFKGSQKLFIAGSTWPLDDDLVLEVFAKMDHKNLKLLIAPHELVEKSVASLESKIRAKNLSVSVFTKGVNAASQVLVLNTMGMLSRAYNYGDLAYVGGGFGDGIHNILEPAVYSIPVAFYGNDFNKYNEAVEMTQNGIAKAVLSPDQLLAHWNELLTDQGKANELKKGLEAYFMSHSNVTTKVMTAIRFV
ncbi:MAG: 3-deoxy-D-manno-octulosonic acid transferase [Sphingobacteriaceae bacterium]